MIPAILNNVCNDLIFWHQTGMICERQIPHILPDEPDMMAAVFRMPNSTVSFTGISLPINEELCLAEEAVDGTVCPCDVLYPLAVLPPLHYDPPNISTWIIDLTNSHLWSSTESSLRTHSPETILAENHLGTLQNLEMATQIQYTCVDKQSQQYTNPDPELTPDTLPAAMTHSPFNVVTDKTAFCSIQLGLLERGLWLEVIVYLLIALN